MNICKYGMSINGLLSNQVDTYNG